MKKSYTIAGIGVCLGKKAGLEALAEAAITGTAIAGKALPDALNLAVKEATQYTAIKNLPILTDTAAQSLGEQKLCVSFKEMLEAAPQNALLLTHRENGWMALALTQEDRGFARVELVDSDETTDGDDFMNFLLSALEIRYALHLNDDPSRMYRFWDATGARSKEILCKGLKCGFTEPKALVNRVYQVKKCLLPVVFTTVAEAKQKLNALKQTANLKDAMANLLPELGSRTETTNTIVLLADSVKSLDEDIDDLLKNADHLLDESFVWKRPSGSRYFRRSCSNPQIVFMNPPASMFNAKAFYKFFLTIYGSMQEISHFKSDKLMTGDKDIFLSDYLFDIVVNYCLTTLLDNIGIRPNVLSGASMGEVANLSNHMVYSDGSVANIKAVLDCIDDALKFMARSDDEPLNAYLGRKTDGFTKFYVRGDAKAICKAAEKYDGVFVMIIGSTEDVILTGERAALRKLIEQTGCVANELHVANYVHTPVVTHLAEEVRKGFLQSDVRLGKLDCTMFSTHFLKPMDQTPEMLADNITALLTRTVDYAAAAEALYDQGSRVFIDLSTTQMCGTWASATLKNRPDALVVSLYSAVEASDMLLNLCAALLASNVPFEQQKLLSKLAFPTNLIRQTTPAKKEETLMVQTTAAAVAPQTAALSGAEFTQVLQKQLMNNEKAFKLFMDAQNKLYEQMLNAPVTVATAPAKTKFPNASKTCLYNREQVVTMTDTSMAAVLGEKYKEVDKYPVRARMPLPPFLFVSRIMSIDAEFGVFRPSSIVTEFDLDENNVFRCSDRIISPLVASEASHVAIFLLGYMGLDAISQGTLSYRAIDSSMTAYSERPFQVGDTLRTVLKIDRFVKNGSTTLLFFTFESYNADELIFITEATGGFFTKADLASNKGIISPKKQLRMNVEPKEFPHLSDTTKTSYNKEEMEAFYRADYLTCFGEKPQPTHKEMYYLPHDIKMVDKVTQIDYNGGIYGRGLICGEKQITPDMWPFKAHFKNDPVFPAIIVSDGVTQLGMFLFAHAGLLKKFPNPYFTSVVGNCVKSRFRGQTRHGYSTMRYEISIKDLVEYEDHIDLFYDAKIFNDEVQIMQIDSYALRIRNGEN